MKRWDDGQQIILLNMFFRLLIVLVGVCAIFAERKSELVLQGDHLLGEVVKSVRPSFNNTAVPASLDYRAQGLLTTDLNQHIPVYWCVCYILYRIILANCLTYRGHAVSCLLADHAGRTLPSAALRIELRLPLRLAREMSFLLSKQ